MRRWIAEVDRSDLEPLQKFAECSRIMRRMAGPDAVEVAPAGAQLIATGPYLGVCGLQNLLELVDAPGQRPGTAAGATRSRLSLLDQLPRCVA